MRIISIVLFLVSLLTTYVHYLVNESSEVQYTLYTDMDSGTYKEESTTRFLGLNTDFPNLSLSALPIKGIIARYYLLGGRFNEATELLNESMYDNPYIMFNEMIKSDLYWELQIKDSIVHYAEKAFTGIPNNQKHFINLARAYVYTNEYDRLDSIYKIVESRAVPDITKYYLSSLLTDESKITEYGRQIARKTLNKKENTTKEIRLASHYVLLGQSNVNESIRLDTEAEAKYLNSDFKSAGETYEKAGEYNPLEYSYFENAGISYFQSGYYDKAIKNLIKVIDSLNPGSGKSEFVIAQSYGELGNKTIACEYAIKSSEFDYRESFKLIGIYCGDSNQ